MLLSEVSFLCNNNCLNKSQVSLLARVRSVNFLSSLINFHFLQGSVCVCVCVCSEPCCHSHHTLVGDPKMYLLFLLFKFQMVV